MLQLILFSLLSVGFPSVTSYEDGCGIYPKCSQYGPGTWQILEDCRKYIICTLVDGELVQQNMVCPGDLVYAEEYGKCVDYNMATYCKIFPDTPCYASCPRFYLESTGPGKEHQDKRLGCFRLSGTVLGVLPRYQNSHAQYLAPDGLSSQFLIHWLIGEKWGTINGGIRNQKYDYIRCPYDGWTQGWEVDTGLGNWVEDKTIVATCFSGDEDVSTHKPTQSTTSAGSTQQPGCQKEGPVMIEACMSDFLCCTKSSSGLDTKKCHCKNGLIFSEELGLCTWPDLEGCTKHNQMKNGTTRSDYECEDGGICETMI